MKNYNKAGKKTHIITWLIGEAVFIFVVATSAIVLYDMYINIDVDEYNNYTAEKTTKEIAISEPEEKGEISEVLENVSKSVVRNIKNCIK